MKKGFTLVEMVVVVIVVAIMISMIPFRMKSLQQYTTFSLVMNDWEDHWQQTITRMRQSNQYKEATISLTSLGSSVLFSGGIASGSTVSGEQFLFPAGMILSTTGTVSWTIGAYGLSCPGYDTGFSLTLGKNTACYLVDKNACTLAKVSCKRQ